MKQDSEVLKVLKEDEDCYVNSYQRNQDSPVWKSYSFNYYLIM